MPGRRRRAEAQGESDAAVLGIAGNTLTFFSLELADLAQEDLDAQMASTPELAQLPAYIDEVRRSQPYNLSKEVERALTVRAPFAGKGKVVEFYGNELSALRFEDPTRRKATRGGEHGGAAREDDRQQGRDDALPCMQTSELGL